MKKKGGISSSKTVQSIIRIFGLFITVIVGVYTVVVGLSYIPGPITAAGELYTYFVGMVMIISGLVQYILFSNTERNIRNRTIWFHVVAFMYMIAVGSISNFPLVPSWIILSTMMYAYYRMPGLIGNLSVFWLSIIVNKFIHDLPNETFQNDILAAVAVSMSAAVIVLFARVQERDDEEFQMSRREEILQRESLLTLVNNLAEAVMTVDEDGKILVYNAAAIGLLDTNASLAGTAIDDILELHDEHKRKVRIRTLLHRAKRVTVNDQLRTTIGGEELRIEITYSPIRQASGQTVKSAKQHYIVILRDVTKLKSLEEERDEFISVVSHELRTPIAITEGAIGNAQLMYAKNADQNETVTKTLDMAHEQVVFLSRMINDLSTLSRAERGVSDEAELINVREMIEMMHREYVQQAQDKSLQLDLEMHGKIGFVKVSRLYLQELMQNFITNAIKYTKEGRVTIQITSENGVITFAVKDTGIGISKTDQTKIFDKFYRSEDYRTRETGGTGLGLYVAVKLAHKLKTTIELTSRLNHGSTFWFKLPEVPKED